MADLNKEQQLGLNLIGQLISQDRDYLISLLKRYGWALDPRISAKTLTGVILETLEYAGDTFGKELTTRLLGESNFTGNKPQVNVGADPISAIAGAIGSVASLVQSATNRKQIKQQAQAATLTALIQARTPQQIVYSPPPSRRRKIWPWIVGAVLLFGSAGLLYYFNSQSK